MIRGCATVALALAITACQAPQERPEPSTAFDGPDPRLLALRDALPGRWSNFAQAQADRAVETLELQIQPLSLASHAQAADFYLLEQSSRDGEAPTRWWVYSVTATEDPEFLLLDIAPLNAAQAAGAPATALSAAEQAFRPGCTLRLVRNADGIAGQSTPGACRFESEGTTRVLLRDVAIGPGRLAVGERLSDPQGQPLAPDRVLHFDRHRAYTGWAGVQVDRDGDPADPAGWRLQSELQAWDDGRMHPLVDAAGDPMGYAVQLSRVPASGERPAMLRLSVIEESSGKTEAYAWGALDARRLGLHLGWLQVGLEARAAR